MISIRKGRVIKILTRLERRTDIIVELDGREEKAINYDKLTGDVSEGDEVILNTTAMELNLGTGGYHFVILNLRSDEIRSDQPGHIMKLRYTPFQLKVLASEEQNSPYHDKFLNFTSLNQMPFIVGTLHSMLVPIATTLKYLNPTLKISYIMTDGASLPINLSNAVYHLKKKKIIDNTITIGHAFGGEYESVNIYNGLITAKEVTKSHLAIVTMGPGIVGTGTPYGFTGIEQAHIIDAVSDLGGTAIAVPRISFGDKRDRHYGLSHHSATALGKIAKTKAYVPLPIFETTQESVIMKQIKDHGIAQKHHIVRREEDILQKSLAHFGLTVKSMGRTYEDDPGFFNTCSAAACFANSFL